MDESSADWDLLRRRTRALAAPVRKGRDERAERYLSFYVGGEEFALATGAVRGVFRLNHLLPVPSSPPSLVGVAAWRGEVLAVVDPVPLLGIASGTDLEDRAWVVVLDVDGDGLGLLTSEVSLLRMNPTELLSPEHSQANGSSSREGLVRGISPQAITALDAEGVATRAVAAIRRPSTDLPSLPA